MWAYGIVKQLFARRPRGKIWTGRAALENVTDVEGCRKKFREAADPSVPFFQIFPYIENFNFIFYTTTEQN